MESSKESCKVCVTGGAGYIGSSLVHSLLQKGYIVHATLRTLGDEFKVGLLKSFPNAKERLFLFEANIYKPEEFEPAIQGCVFVFHVATPLQHTTGYKYNNLVDATVNSVKTIANACIRSGTVKRLIYTGSVFAASPLNEDGNGYKITMDESCWTPLQLNVPYSNDFLKDYKDAKTKSEQELLKIGEDVKANDHELEIVTLTCGLVGGASYLPHLAGSVLTLLSQVLNNAASYNNALRHMEELLGKIPIVHIDDVWRAHIFCAETPSVQGRFLCARAYISSSEIAKYYQETYPQYCHFNQEYLREFGRDIKFGSTKLEDKGFAYKYSTKNILDDSIEFAKRSNHG
uniref:putative anthocyanidin reductase n=1 Tax=Erigeron canadensis TaxID=72917 RepID=UPI001CB89278|nr:putative anthocyanidin reductase [Erigeron canadensis]